MALPGKKCPRSGKRHRLSWFKQKPKGLGVCLKCKKPILPHRACSFCGFYRGREVMIIKLKTKKGKKEATKEKTKEKKPKSEK